MYCRVQSRTLRQTYVTVLSVPTPFVSSVQTMSTDMNPSRPLVPLYRQDPYVTLPNRLRVVTPFLPDRPRSVWSHRGVDGRLRVLIHGPGNTTPTTSLVPTTGLCVTGQSFWSGSTVPTSPPPSTLRGHRRPRVERRSESP